MPVLMGNRVDVLLKHRRDCGVYSCTLNPCKTTAVLHVPADVDQLVSVSSSLTLLQFNLQWLDGCIHLYIDHGKGGKILFHPAVGRGAFRVAELFGGLGGWSCALEHIGCPPIAIIDHDRTVVAACARAHNAEIMSASDFFEKAMKQQIQSLVVVHACVEDPLVWAGLTALNVAVVTISPPCQPWSNSGKQTGLSVADGAVFATVLKMAGSSQMHAVLGENVKGFPQHDDYPVLIGGAAMDGLMLVSEGIFPLQRALPVIRDRWLGVFVNASTNIPDDHVQAAKDLHLGHDMFALPLPGPSLRDQNAIHVNITSGEFNELIPNEKAIQLLTRFDLLPVWMRQRVKGADPDSVMKARCLSPETKVSGIMARYGFQHELPIEHLKSKGLMTMLLSNGYQTRYYSPWELLAAMGFPPTTVISKDLRDSFQQCGNAISPVHAWIAIAKATVLLGDMSIFPKERAKVQSLIALLGKSMKLSEWVVDETDDLLFLKRLVVGCGIPHDESDAKKQKVEAITPTVPMQSQPDLGTAIMETCPDFCMQHVSSAVSLQPFCEGGLAVLLHAQRHWSTLVHASPEAEIGKLCKTALPHAKQEHFVGFSVNDCPSQWDQLVKCCPKTTIVFEPAVFRVMCELLTDKRLPMLCDVTWTTETAAAFIAAHMRCNVNSIQLRHNDMEVLPGDFLLAYEPCEFRMSFKACMPAYVSFAPREEEASEKGLTPVTPGCLRFAARHPLKKVVRTVCVQDGASYASLVKALFPELCNSLAWKIYHNNEELNPALVVVDSVSLKIERDCFKPVPVTEVERVAFDLPVDAMRPQVEAQQCPPRWVKSPFKVKPSVLRLRGDVSLIHVAASFMTPAQCDATLLCQLGSALLDPSTKLSDVPLQEVLSFRVTPLLGGAKSLIKEPFRAKLKQVFMDHGVDRDAVDDRLADFLAKCDEETLLKDINSDQDKLWATVKSEANRIHFRLVYRGEVKNARTIAKRKPPAKEKRKAPTLSRDDFTPTAQNIRIDMSHFWDEDRNVTQLDARLFGPDQKGLAIMSVTEADRHMSSHKLSMDALAILVVGKKFGPDDSIFPCLPLHMVTPL